MTPLETLEAVEEAINEHPGEDISDPWLVVMWDAYFVYDGGDDGVLQAFGELANLLENPHLTQVVLE